MKFSSAAVMALVSATGVAAFLPAISVRNSNKAATAFYRSPLSASASSTKSIRLAMSSTTDEAEVVPIDSTDKKETFEFTVRDLLNHQRMNTSINECLNARNE
jgi:hypothetical protein